MVYLHIHEEKTESLPGKNIVSNQLRKFLFGYLSNSNTLFTSIPAYNKHKLGDETQKSYPETQRYDIIFILGGHTLSKIGHYRWNKFRGAGSGTVFLVLKANSVW